jgi:hypothetical protein
MENLSDKKIIVEPSFESQPISEKDAMGREKFWEDLGRPND